MPADGTLKVLLLGDVYGAPGCRALIFKLPQLKKQFNPDFVIVNGENACAGFGLDRDMMYRFLQAGVDVITGGNHIWQQEDLLPCLDSEPRLLRPANYPPSNPGRGMTVIDKIAVINLQGRYGMQPLDCPFRTALNLVREARRQTPLIFVDFHAENTAEKEALGFLLDGKVTAVVGSHTHVQTADAKILPGGTAYITDMGMCGPSESVIGSDPASAVLKQRTQMPYKPVVAETAPVINGVLVCARRGTGRALEITPVSIPCEE